MTEDGSVSLPSYESNKSFDLSERYPTFQGPPPPRLYIRHSFVVGLYVWVPDLVTPLWCTRYVSSLNMYRRSFPTSHRVYS